MYRTCSKPLMRPYPSDSMPRRCGVLYMYINIPNIKLLFFRIPNPSVHKYKVPPPKSAPPLPMSAQRNPPVYPMYGNTTLVLHCHDNSSFYIGELLAVKGARWSCANHLLQAQPSSSFASIVFHYLSLQLVYNPNKYINN